MSETIVRKKNKQLKNKLIPAAELIPRTKKALQVLNQRAEHFSILNVSEEKSSQTTTYVKFRITENEYYGIPFQFVKEVMHNVILTRLPHTPDYIAGIMNRRSSLITVLDLQYIFHHKPSEPGKNPYIIIVIKNNLILGLLTHGIVGSDAYDANTLNPPIASEAIQNMEYIIGLHNGDTAIINIESILSDNKLLKEDY